MNEHEIDKIDKLIEDALKDESRLPDGIEQRLAQHIDDLEKAGWRASFTARKIVWQSIGIAASLLLIIGLSAGIYRINNNRLSTPYIADTYSSPEEAAEAAGKTLAFVAQKLNKGLTQAANAENKIQRVNTIIENLNSYGPIIPPYLY